MGWRRKASLPAAAAAARFLRHKRFFVCSSKREPLAATPSNPRYLVPAPPQKHTVPRRTDSPRWSPPDTRVSTQGQKQPPPTQKKRNTLTVSTQHLVFGVGGVHPLAVPAGLQQDGDGVELQQDLAGHAVEEGDVGQGRRRQQEDLAAGGALAQLCQVSVAHTGTPLPRATLSDRPAVGGLTH